MKVATFLLTAAAMCAMFVSLSGCSPNADSTATTSTSEQAVSDDPGTPSVPKVELAKDLAEPVPLDAGGSNIDIGGLSNMGHAGPCIADIDCDGDDDLLVGDFPGYFWYFENVSDGPTPEYASAVKLQAGGEDAKVPVY